MKDERDNSVKKSKKINDKDSFVDNDKFLNNVTRLRYIEELKELGYYVNDEEISDNDLFTRVCDALREERNKRIEAETDASLTQLNEYASYSHDRLKDKDFIMRLKQISMPPEWLQSFEDSDAKYNDEELYDIARRKGMSHFKDTADIFKDRTIKPVRKKKRYEDDEIYS